MGNVPHAIVLERWDRELSSEIFHVSDRPRLTERGVKFFQRKVESFEEVSCRDGRGLGVGGRRRGEPLLPVAELRSHFSAFEGPLEAHPRL